MSLTLTLLRDIKRSIREHTPTDARALHCIYRKWNFHYHLEMMYADQHSRWQPVIENDIEISFDLHRPMCKLADSMSPLKDDPFELNLTFDPTSARSVAICRRYKRNIVKNSGEYVLEQLRRRRMSLVKLTREEQPDWDNACPIQERRHTMLGRGLALRPVKKQPFFRSEPRDSSTRSQPVAR